MSALSNHSFGVAIDVNTDKSAYWRWQPAALLRGLALGVGVREVGPPHDARGLQRGGGGGLVRAAGGGEHHGCDGGAAQRFHLDAPGWFRETPAPALLPAVADAVWDDRRLLARYRRQDSEVSRELEPYGLVLKAGVWYLCARVPDPGSGSGSGSGSYRVYRIDRFTSVEPHGENRFVRDEDFDLPGFWEERAAQFARAILRESVVLRLSPDGARQLPYVTDRAAAHEALADAEPDERGRVTITLPVESTVVAYSQLLMLGPEAEVLGPPELRDRLAATAARMAALYR